MMHRCVMCDKSVRGTIFDFFSDTCFSCVEIEEEKREKEKEEKKEEDKKKEKGGDTK